MAESVNVLVAGAGAAGLTAALASAERGASVIIAEASLTFRQGSNTAMSTAMLPAAGTRWQHERGIDDSAEVFLSDVMAKTKGQADLPLATALTGRAAAVTEWLADRCQVPFELVTDFNYPGHSAPRCHTVSDRSGQTLLSYLLDAVEAQPAITLMKPVRLIAVEHAEPGFRCTVQVPDQPPDGIDAERVILCTNGFGANAELISRHIPAAANLIYHGSPESTGDAVRIGTSLGADTAFMDAFQGHGSLAVPHAVLLTWAAMIYGGLLLNHDGRRFTNESLGYSESALAVAGQEGAQAWAVFDESIAAACRAFADFQELEAAGAISWADDAAAIARLASAPLDAVSDSLAQAADFVAGHQRDPLGRANWHHSLTPPYALVRVGGALFHTQGGLRVDPNGKVLHAGRPIQGLYAAGGAAMGISGHGAGGYLGGNGLLSAFVLGYAAGISSP